MNGENIDAVFKFPFRLDTFQIDAVVAILEGKNVLSLGHTGSGKTSIGVFAIAYTLRQNKRAIFTTPIKSLSNQKYGDFQRDFPNNSVGILTGDIKVNPDADVLVATQEIICNLLYTNLEYFNDVGLLVIDEAHYINGDRGSIYEQTISMLPKHINLVMLSATMNKPRILKNWIEKIKEIPCVVTSTSYRPVPLKHNVYYDEHLTEIKNGDNDFDDQKYRRIFNLWKEDSLKRLKDKDSVNTKFKKFIDVLLDEELFPSLFFNFSRKGCEKFAKMIERTLISGKEQTEAINLFDYNVKKYLGESGLQSPQYWMLREFISKGVCVHHSGLIPILKEIVEILFDKKYIKLLFVTETFSVGINMPTKCVVFSELQKFDGKCQRILNHTEYVQMAGRAGRRGKDVIGNVIYFQISNRNMLTTTEFAQIVRGSSALVTSRFDVDAKYILRCIDNDKNIEEEFKNTLLSNEIDSSVIGIEHEINNIIRKLTNVRKLQIDNKVFKTYSEIQKLEQQKYIVKPKKRKTIQIEINSLKIEISKTDIRNIEVEKSLLFEKKKLENQQDDTSNYVKNSIIIKTDELKKHGYMTIDGKMTLKGKAVCCVNESDGFLIVEYLQNLFASYNQKFYTKDDMIYIIPFVIGSLIDDRNLHNIDDSSAIVDEVFKEKTRIDNVKYEIDLLKRLHERFQSEDTISAIFGACVYLWLEKKSFNEIQQQIHVDIYEGNFVKNILKIYNMCEEMLRIIEIFSISPEIYEVVNDIKSNLLRDIVTCDSIYIKSA